MNEDEILNKFSLKANIPGGPRNPNIHLYDADGNKVGVLSLGALFKHAAKACRIVDDYLESEATKTKPDTTYTNSSKD